MNNLRNKIVLGLIIFMAAITGGFLIIPKAHAAYSCHRSITVTSTVSVASGTNSNFPMLVSNTLVSFETTSTNVLGRFQNALGYDHNYSTSSACTSFLNYENEQYVSSTGALIDWVNVPTMAAGTVIYICYGDSSISTSQANPSSTWDSNYVGVWHLNDQSATTTILDSTANANKGTIVSSTQVTATSTGKIDGAQAFSGLTSGQINIPYSSSLGSISSTYTFSAWTKHASSSCYYGACGLFYNSNVPVSGFRGLVIAFMSDEVGQGKMQVSHGDAWAYSYGFFPYNTTGRVDIIYSTSTSLMSWYSNGSFKGTSTIAKAPQLGTSGFIIGYGSINWGGGNYPGMIDEERISNVVRSPSWILTEYNNQSSPSTFYTVGSEETTISVYTRATVLMSVTSGNPPQISVTAVNGGSPITLTPASTQPVNVNFTITSANGCAAVFTSGNVTTTLYRIGAGSSCTPDNRNCYVTSSQTNDCTSGNTANATATLDLYYFADSTGVPSSSYSSDHWQAFVQALDWTGNATGTATSSALDVNVMTALTITTSSINYGQMTPNSTTTLLNDQLANVQNVGNSSTTLLISGTALTMGGGADAFNTSSQHYATSSFTFGLSEQSLSDTVTTVPGFSVIPPHIDLTPLVQNWTNTQSLPTSTHSHSSVAYNGYVYVIGGWTTAATSTVRYAQIQSSGTLGAWADTQALPARIRAHSSAVYNGYVYEIGGYDANNDTTSTVRYAQIQSSGTLGAWMDTQALQVDIADHSSVAYNGYVYEIGGCIEFPTCGTLTSTIRYTQIQSDGTLGAWTNTQALPTAIANPSSIAYNGYVYVIGGNVTAVDATSTVRYAQIQSSGTIANWSSTTALPESTSFHSSVVYNGYVYVIGGGVTSTVRYAQIQSNGTLGAWMNTQALPAGTYRHSSIAYNGYVYEIGGEVAAGATSTVRYTSLDNRPTYWGVQIPGGAQAGLHTGTITFSSQWSP